MKRAVAICSRADCTLKEIAKRLAFREAERENERYHATKGFIGENAK